MPALPLAGAEGLLEQCAAAREHSLKQRNDGRDHRFGLSALRAVSVEVAPARDDVHHAVLVLEGEDRSRVAVPTCRGPDAGIVTRTEPDDHQCRWSPL